MGSSHVGGPPRQPGAEADSMNPLSFSGRRIGAAFSRNGLPNGVNRDSRATPAAKKYPDSVHGAVEGKSIRELSVSSALQQLTLNPVPLLPPPPPPMSPVRIGRCRSPSPTHIPKKERSTTSLRGSTAGSSPTRTPKGPRITGVGPFLSVESNLRGIDWNLQKRMDSIESEITAFRTIAATAQAESKAQQESLTISKSQGTSRG